MHITMNNKNKTDIKTVKVTVIVGNSKEVLCTKQGNIIVSRVSYTRLTSTRTLSASGNLSRKVDARY